MHINIFEATAILIALAIARIYMKHLPEISIFTAIAVTPLKYSVYKHVQLAVTGGRATSWRKVGNLNGFRCL